MNLRSTLLLVADGVPMSRKEICEAALAHPKFAGGKVPEFGGSGVDGKRDESLINHIGCNVEWCSRTKLRTRFSQPLILFCIQ